MRIEFNHQEVLEFARRSLRGEGIIVFRCDRSTGAPCTYEGFRVESLVTTFSDTGPVTRIDLQGTLERLYWQKDSLVSAHGSFVSGGVWRQYKDDSVCDSSTK